MAWYLSIGRSARNMDFWMRVHPLFSRYLTTSRRVLSDSMSYITKKSICPAGRFRLLMVLSIRSILSLSGGSSPFVSAGCWFGGVSMPFCAMFLSMAI